MSTAPRRFPAPWSVRELEQAFAARGGNGQAVAYTYFRRDENEARQARVLTRNEARRIAANIVRLPERARPATEFTPALERTCARAFHRPPAFLWDRVHNDCHAAEKTYRRIIISNQ